MYLREMTRKCASVIRTLVKSMKQPRGLTFCAELQK